MSFLKDLNVKFVKYFIVEELKEYYVDKEKTLRIFGDKRYYK